MRPNSPLRRAAWVLAGCLLSATVALAAPVWKQLNERQQALIEPALRSQGASFDSLPEARRAQLVRGADRWLAMSPEQRTVATQQFQRWQQLTAAEKVAVLERRERFRKLPPGERQALLDTQKQFLELPLQQQAELRDQFKELERSFDGLPPGFGTQSPGTPGTPNPLGLPVNPASPMGLPLNLAPLAGAAGITAQPLPPPR